MKSKFTVKCPRCRKLGRLRLKDKRFNSVVMSHYDSEKYQKGKAGGSMQCYIGTIRDPEKLINKVCDKDGINYSKGDKKEFKKIVQKFTKTIKEDKETDITQNEITIMTSILNELRKVRKAEETKNKIEDRKLEWTPFDCPSCKNKIKVWAKFRGVQTKKQIKVWHSTKVL